MLKRESLSVEPILLESLLQFPYFFPDRCCASMKHLKVPLPNSRLLHTRQRFPLHWLLISTKA